MSIPFPIQIARRSACEVPMGVCALSGTNDAEDEATLDGKLGVTGMVVGINPERIDEDKAPPLPPPLVF